MATHHPIRKIVAKPEPVIPDKLYFRIGDVARLCEVPAYVLRFWETEFANLKPNKGGTGQRLYRRKDVEIALRIKHLLYDLGYTIPGARQVFKAEVAAKADTVPAFAAGEAQDAAHLAVVATEPRSTSPRSADTGNVSSFPMAESRLARLQAIREDLLALRTQLSAPVATFDGGEKAAAAPRAMRPRLVLEPRPKLEKVEMNPAQRVGPIVLPGQQDLFPAN